MNPNTLNSSLTSLIRGGLVENYLQRVSGKREYSFYRLTAVGRAVLDVADDAERFFANSVEMRLRYFVGAPLRIQPPMNAPENIFAEAPINPYLTFSENDDELLYPISGANGNRLMSSDRESHLSRREEHLENQPLPLP